MLRATAFIGVLAGFGCNDPVSLSRNPIPVRSNRLASSGREVCLVQTDGTAKCWGERGARRLTLPDGRRFIRLSGGINHLCGLANDSTAWCWGRSNEGQLGNGKTTGGILPERVETPLRFIAVSAGSSSSCALDGAGLLYCWGSNRSGGLANGQGSTTDIALAPTRAKSSVQFKDVDQNCALSLAQRAYCWIALEGFGVIGYYHAEPGDCSLVYYSDFVGKDCWAPTPVASPTPVAGLGECLLDLSGDVYCFGSSGSDGSFGDGRSGDGVYAVIPVKVLGDEKYRAVSGTCALALDGVAYCWGSNVKGRLGTGDGLGRTQPTPVLTDERFVEISSNLNTCALTAAGEVWCWGPNEFGINGPTATGTQASVPVRVELPPL